MTTEANNSEKKVNLEASQTDSSEADISQQEIPAGDRATYVPAGPETTSTVPIIPPVAAPEQPAQDPVEPVISGIGNSIDGAINNMLQTEGEKAPDSVSTAAQGFDPEDESPTQVKRPSETPQLEQGEAIEIDDLDPEIRDDVEFDETFHNLQHGIMPTSSSDIPPVDSENPADRPQPAGIPTLAAPPIPVETAKSSKDMPTLPAPAPAISPILPSSIPVDVDFDEEETGPRAGVFRVPNLIPPNFTRTSPLPPTPATPINEKETIAPPAGYSSSIPFSIGGGDQARKTADYSEDAAIFWAFVESDIYMQYEAAMKEYEKQVKTNPNILKPEMEEYLACFRATRK